MPPLVFAGTLEAFCWLLIGSAFIDLMSWILRFFKRFYGVSS